MHHTKSIIRSTFGELVLSSQNPLVVFGKKLLEEAIAKEYLDPPYVDVDKKHRGSALNYDVYDISSNEVLIQQRYTECTKYGNSPTKNYLTIRKQGKAILVLGVSDDAKAFVVKRSKAAKVLGEVLEVLHRKDEVFSPPAKGLMVVEVMQHDRLHSLEFKLPVWRTKDSTTACNGENWFHVFSTRARLDSHIQNNPKCQDALMNGKQLAIIEVVPKGRLFRQQDPHRFLVSGIKFIKQIELIQPSSLITCSGEPT